MTQVAAFFLADGTLTRIVVSDHPGLLESHPAWPGETVVPLDRAEYDALPQAPEVAGLALPFKISALAATIISESNPDLARAIESKVRVHEDGNS